jgi:hypothetical protein
MEKEWLARKLEAGESIEAIAGATRSFGICNGHTWTLDLMREEAARCVLLCAACHAEVESGSAQLAVPSAEARPSRVAQSDDPG